MLPPLALEMSVEVLDRDGDLLRAYTVADGRWRLAGCSGCSIPLRRRSLDMNVLMALAAVGAVGIGAYAEGAWVLVLFAVGTGLEAMALERSRRSVRALTDLAPAQARLLAGMLPADMAPDARLALQQALDGVARDELRDDDGHELVRELLGADLDDVLDQPVDDVAVVVVDQMDLFVLRQLREARPAPPAPRR